MTFSGEDYPTWSNLFSAFAQTKGLFGTLTDTVELPDRPAPLREDANDAQTREHEAQTNLELQLYKKMRTAKIRSGATWG